MRRRILDAARELFGKHGYEAVTMRGIAEKIEYSATALYFHFEDKEALLRELCANDFLELATAFRTIAREPDPIERLRKAGRAYVQFALDHPNQYRFMFLTPHPPVPPDTATIEKGNPEQDAWAFLMGTVQEALAAGRFREELSDAASIALAIWSGIHGVIAVHIAKEGDPWVDWRPLPVVSELMIDVLVRGLVREGSSALAPPPRRPARSGRAVRRIRPLRPPKRIES